MLLDKKRITIMDYKNSFMKDETGATAIEVGVIVSIVGAAIAVSAYLWGDLLSSMFFTLADCVGMGFDPECYSVHNNTTEFGGETPSWWAH